MPRGYKAQELPTGRVVDDQNTGAAIRYRRVIPFDVDDSMERGGGGIGRRNLDALQIVVEGVNLLGCWQRVRPEQERADRAREGGRGPCAVRDSVHCVCP